MTPYESACAALRRPHNFTTLHPREQWRVDAGLGILDWEGFNMEAAREVLASGNEAATVQKFGMTLAEVRDIADRFALVGV